LLRKKEASEKVAFYKMYYHTKFQDFVLVGASISHTSEAVMIIVLVLLMVGNKKRTKVGMPLVLCPVKSIS
jgi:hypothetical protein